MKTLLLLLPLMLISLAHAHDKHDWRLDVMAYLSLEYQGPLVMAHHKSVQVAKSIELDMTFFKEKLKVFSSSKRDSTKGLDRSRDMLKTEYQKLGYDVFFQPFGTGTNFIAEKKGKSAPGRVLILSSHIDSFGNLGANDNGTGTIGLLTAAKILAKKDYSHTIRILGFDREEDGLLGSDAYVATLNKADIIGNINFEMMGVNSRQDGAFHVIDCNRMESVFLSVAIKEAISSQNLALQVVETCTNRSDHASFWRKKIPAIVISENFFGGDPDPCYHESCDVMDERLNYNYMEKILSAVVEASENLLK